MNGIEKILERLQSDSQAEADAILAKAQSEADGIAARYGEQAQQLRTSLEEKGRTAAAERQDRLVRAAEMESRKMVLAAKQSMLDRAFALAYDKLRNMPEEEYRGLLVALAARSAQSGTETVLFNEADRKALGRQVVEAANAQRAAAGQTASLTLAEETADISGGLMLRDRESEVNCSFDTLLHLSRETLAARAAALLFA